MFLKISQYTQGNACVGVSFKLGYSSSVCNFTKKRLQHRRLTHVNFAKYSRFFKNTYGRIILKKHWISLKTTPIAIPVNVSNASYQKGCVFFYFLRAAYGNFVDISMEISVKVF